MIDNSNNEKTTQKNEQNQQKNPTITKIEQVMHNFANSGLGRFLTGFGNAQIAGESGAATAVATASGYEYNPENRRFEQTEERLNDPSVKALRNNLEVLSTFSETHPYSILAKGLGYLWKWRPFLPKGSETTVYRQGGMDMIDDALESGVIRPQPEANYTAKVAADKAAGNRILLRKQFKEVMFNRQKPFYGNPGLFEKSYKGVFVGDMNKSSAQWIQNFHKNHKNIFEPILNRFLVPKNEQKHMMSFYLSGMGALMIEWIKNDCKEDIQTIINILLKCFNLGEMSCLN